jgi:hypothetical protein
MLGSEALSVVMSFSQKESGGSCSFQESRISFIVPDRRLIDLRGDGSHSKLRAFARRLFDGMRGLILRIDCHSRSCDLSKRRNEGAESERERERELELRLSFAG